MKLSDSLSTLRHSAAHLLAHAISELYPETKFTIGPATPEGFFYDFLPKKNLKEPDLEAIEKRMHEIQKRNVPITHSQIPKDKARLMFLQNPFKLELINNIKGDTVGLATQGEFKDLCKGGHVAATGDIKYFTLLGISGSYWRADKSGKQLQRISGTAFPTKQELDNYLQKCKDALQYDHRKLGKQLDLFSFQEQGVGFPFFHPKGKTVLNVMTDYVRTLLTRADYQEIATPTMLSSGLWKQSGHYNFYKDNMYFAEVEGDEYVIKPMNCPGAILVYKNHPRSYRELPLRLSEFGTVHRYELSGVLHGLFRSRVFTIDDGHIFCTTDQLEEEIYRSIQLTLKVLKQFGFDTPQLGLSTKPKKAMGSDVVWEGATNALKTALQQANVPYKIYEGEGAFYGPKIEFTINDSMGREWQCGTIQVDFFQPENFDLTFIASNGQKERPVMIHRAIYGSFERFFAIMLEHFRGALPFWLAPVQIRVLTITDAQKQYAQHLVDILQSEDIRAELDTSSDQISSKIRAAQVQKVPWMIIIGDREVDSDTATLRYLNGSQEFGIPITDVLKRAVTSNAYTIH
jgi:threonyl-tRNA synthetase